MRGLIISLCFRRVEIVFPKLAKYKLLKALAESYLKVEVYYVMSIDLRKLLSVQKSLTNIHLSPQAGDWMTDKGQEKCLNYQCKVHKL